MVSNCTTIQTAHALFGCIGTGLHFGYAPFNAFYHELLIAAMRMKSNVGFLIYVSGSFGYLGSVLISPAKQFSGLRLLWTSLFISLVLFVSVFGLCATAAAALYFRKKYKDTKPGKRVAAHISYYFDTTSISVS